MSEETNILTCTTPYEEEDATLINSSLTSGCKKCQTRQAICQSLKTCFFPFLNYNLVKTSSANYFPSITDSPSDDEDSKQPIAESEKESDLLQIIEILWQGFSCFVFETYKCKTV